MTKHDITLTILIGLLITIIGIFIKATDNATAGLIVIGVGVSMIAGAGIQHYFSKGK